MKRNTKRKNEGITLIALVITIIVLLILAGVTIAMLMGDNGILTKATEAKNDQADATVKEAIALLWNEYQLEIKSSSNEGVKESTQIASTEITKIQGEGANYLATTATSFWEFLLTDKEVINANGIVDVQKLTGQTLDRGNGTDTDIYKIEEKDNFYTLNYINENGESKELWKIELEKGDGVEINISKQEIKIQNSDKIIAVELTVDSINGEELSFNKVTEEEYKNMLLDRVNKMVDEEKKELYVKLYNLMNNTDFKNFQEVLKNVMRDYPGIEEMTEEEIENLFYEEIVGKEEFPSFLVECVWEFNYNLIGEYNKETEELLNANVTNPDGKKEISYVATENGDYTFSVEIDGKQYYKTITINNIQNEENNEKDRYEVSDYNYDIALRDIELSVFTTFSQAYIILDDIAIDVSEYIKNEDEVSILEEHIVQEISGIHRGEVDIIIIKDGKVFYGKEKVGEIR